MKHLAITFQVKEVYLSPCAKKIRAKNKKGKFSENPIILNKDGERYQDTEQCEYEFKTVPKMTMFVTEDRTTPQSQLCFTYTTDGVIPSFIASHIADLIESILGNIAVKGFQAGLKKNLKEW